MIPNNKEHSKYFAPKYRGPYLDSYKSTDALANENLDFRKIQFKDQYWLIAATNEKLHFDRESDSELQMKTMRIYNAQNKFEI